MRVANLCLGLLLAGAAVGAQEPSPPRGPQIVTAASGEVRVSPDRAILVVGVQTRAVTASDAAAQNARLQRAIIDAIKARGVAIEDIGTSGYSVTPEMRYKEGEPPQVTGFVVSNEVTVTVRAIENVGRIIDASLGSGANQVNSLTFTVSNPDSARRSALAAAVARSRADAEVMARAAGGSLGSLLELTSTEETPSPPRPVMAMSRAAVDEASTPIESGQTTIRATVTARWRFVPGQP